MRKNLRKLEGKKLTFNAVFGRYGQVAGQSKKSILLNNIKINGNNRIIVNHLWLNNYNGFQISTIESGDIIQFDAVVEMYFKASGHDYTLINPRNIKLIG